MKARSTPPEARVIAAVMAAELARTRRTGLILASPPGPAGDLLARWLTPIAPLRTPDPGAVADVAGALAAAGAPGTAVEALAWRAVAEARAEAEGSLTVGTTNKLQLLLDPAPLPARVLPLGDVWASRLRAEGGGDALPPVLGGMGPEEVTLAEAVLRDYLEGGADPHTALARLGGLATPVRQALDAAEPRRQGVLVPKLEGWTVGSDLAR